MTATGGSIRAGRLGFSYDASGALARRVAPGGDTVFEYGDDALLNFCRLPSGTVIRYEGAPAMPVNPARRYRNEVLTTEYLWESPVRLLCCRDFERELEFAFSYDARGFPARVRITPLWRPGKFAAMSLNDPGWLAVWAEEFGRERFRGLFGARSEPVELACGCDQVGTIKVLADAAGRAVKMMEYDSFGNPLADSLEALFLPLGFAGGLADADTGLVRFGWRDYDPLVGRFTARDPLGDTGGDHDLYDYCVDDPMNMRDPAGLFQDLIGFTQQRSLQEAATRPYEEKEPELAFTQALGEAWENKGDSAAQFAESIYDVITNPGQTVKGLLSVLAGYGCQLFGVDSVYRADSDAASNFFSERYGSWAQFKKTLAKDPIGLAADLSSVLTVSAGAVGGLANVGKAASRAAPAGRIAAKAGQVAEHMGQGNPPRKK